MKNVLLSVIALVLLTSCIGMHPTYRSCPIAETAKAKKITYSFGLQVMDNNANVDNSVLTAQYPEFDIKYKLVDSTLTFEIQNKTNKSMIIDKSKCYVLYNGYSNNLFRDVRSTRSTTFNNVQDAINNVQTNEGGVVMTIPPYSAYRFQRSETNLQAFKEFPSILSMGKGDHPLTYFDNKENVEFIIPYSFDYSLAKWETSRVRAFVNNINIADTIVNIKTVKLIDWQYGSIIHYKCKEVVEIQDYETRNSIVRFKQIEKIVDVEMISSINKANKEIEARHKRIVIPQAIFWTIVTVPTGAIPFLIWYYPLVDEPPYCNCSTELSEYKRKAYL